MKHVLFILLLSISFQDLAQETIKISGLEFMAKDLGKMDWNKAQKICDSMGNGWRLPTKDDFLKLVRLITIVGEIKPRPEKYWGIEINKEYAYYTAFAGSIGSDVSQDYSIKNELNIVRLVREDSTQSFSPESIKLKSIGLEIMKNDIGQCDYFVAIEICEMLENGWRLPTKDELIKMYKLRESIGGFRNYGRGYWTSSDYSDASKWCVNFSDGNIYFDGKFSDGQLRAVRTLK